MPKISILTPFRNAEAFIEETASSIFKQTHANWEWILINDHSEQNEISLLQEYLTDPRVQVISNKGKGITDALISGFSLTKGDYVTRMDADDVMPENKLQILLENLLSQEADIVTGKVNYFSSDGQISPGYQKYEKWLNERVDQQDFYREIYRECTLASGNWLMKREVLNECGGFEGLVYPEDYDLLFRWYENNLKIFGIQEVTHLWREHPLRTSKNSDDYGQRSFFDLKVNRFVQHDLEELPLVLNGTGTKGRLAAAILLERGISFDWVSVEPEKFKGGVYGKTIIGSDVISYEEPIQILNASSIKNEDVETLYADRNKVKRIVML